MPMAQFPPDDFHLNILHAPRSRRATALVLVLGRIRRGNVLFPLQAKKQITPLVPNVKSVDASIFKAEAISLGSGEFNWQDYYSRTLTALMSDLDKLPPGE